MFSSFRSESQDICISQKFATLKFYERHLEKAQAAHILLPCLCPLGFTTTAQNSTCMYMCLPRINVVICSSNYFC